MSVLDDLMRIGFAPVTQWVLKGQKIGPPSFSWEDRSGWLYAFVVDSEVKYIGRTSRVLRSRMGDYSHIKSSQTARLRVLITGELNAGRTVEVYGWKQRDSDIRMVEEGRLVSTYCPP